jgi:hypothetical protein
VAPRGTLKPPGGLLGLRAAREAGGDHPGPDADLRIMVVRLSDGGVYRLGADRAQVAWSTGPGLRVGGSTYPGLTCLYSPLAEEAELSSGAGTELFVVEFPRLD